MNRLSLPFLTVLAFASLGCQGWELSLTAMTNKEKQRQNYFEMRGPVGALKEHGARENHIERWEDTMGQRKRDDNPVALEAKPGGSDVPR